MSADVHPTTERTDTSIVVSAVLCADPERVFALLADPARHPLLDGSGMVRGAVDPRPLTAAGQTFVMDMHQPHLGDYQTVNTVLEVRPGTRVAWTTARVGNPPAGVRWQWDVSGAGPGSSLVVQTYDWSQVTDPAVLARVSFPRVSADQIAATIAHLAAAVG